MYAPPKSTLPICTLSVTIGEQPYSCKVPGCEAAYSQAYNLTLHVKAAHKPKSLDFPCPVAGCDKNYTSKNSLLAHTRAKHAARALPCSSCRGSHENIDQLRRCVSTVSGNSSWSTAC